MGRGVRGVFVPPARPAVSDVRQVVHEMKNDLDSEHWTRYSPDWMGMRGVHPPPATRGRGTEWTRCLAPTGEISHEHGEAVFAVGRNDRGGGWTKFFSPHVGRRLSRITLVLAGCVVVASALASEGQPGPCTACGANQCKLVPLVGGPCIATQDCCCCWEIPPGGTVKTWTCRCKSFTECDAQQDCYSGPA